MSTIFSSQRKSENVSLIDHFLSTNIGGEFGFLADTAGAGSSVSSLAGLLDSPGLRRIQAGTPTTARAAIRLQLASFADLNLNIYDFECRIALQSLAVSPNFYVLNVGFMNDFTVTLPTNGIYITYNFVNYGTHHWRCVTSNSGSTTVLSSGVAVTSGGLAFNKLRILTNGAGSALFYVNGQHVATINTNLPAWPSATTTYGVALLKQSGTANITADVDYVKIYKMPHL